MTSLFIVIHWLTLLGGCWCNDDVGGGHCYSLLASRVSSSATEQTRLLPMGARLRNKVCTSYAAAAAVNLGRTSARSTAARSVCVQTQRPRLDRHRHRCVGGGAVFVVFVGHRLIIIRRQWAQMGAFDEASGLVESSRVESSGSDARGELRVSAALMSGYETRACHCYLAPLSTSALSLCSDGGWLGGSPERRPSGELNYKRSAVSAVLT